MPWARLYFGAQAVGGALWWMFVFTVPLVRDATLGSLDPVVVAVFDLPLFVGASALAALGVRTAAIVATAWTALVTVALAAYATVTTEAGWGVIVMIAASCGSVLALCLMTLNRVPTEWILAGPFGFRPAKARGGPSAHVIATAAQIAVFWGLFLVVFPLAIVTLESRWGLDVTFPPVVRWSGVFVLALASALGIWAAAAMSTKGGGTPLPAATAIRLVIAGPYRFVRNPMALAGIVQGVAVGLILSSWMVVAYAIAGSVVWNWVVRPLEEADLEIRFGEDFRSYRSAVRCWVPRLRPVAPRPVVR